LLLGNRDGPSEVQLDVESPLEIRDLVLVRGTPYGQVLKLSDVDALRTKALSARSPKDSRKWIAADTS
jgi:hypothetical protein